MLRKGIKLWLISSILIQKFIDILWTHTTQNASGPDVLQPVKLTTPQPASLNISLSNVSIFLHGKVIPLHKKMTNMV